MMGPFTKPLAVKVAHEISGTSVIRHMLRGSDLEMIADAVCISCERLERFVCGDDDVLSATLLGDIVVILSSGEICFDHVNNSLKPCTPSNGRSGWL